MRQLGGPKPALKREIRAPRGGRLGITLVGSRRVIDSSSAMGRLKRSALRIKKKKKR